MTRDEATRQAVRYWLAKARECLASAEDEARSGRLSFAVHRDLVKPGLLPEDLGRIYDRLFHDRQQGDYIEFVSFDAEDVGSTVGESRQLVGALEVLAATTG